MVAVIMLIKFDVASGGDIENIIKRSHIIEIECAPGLIATAFPAASIIHPRAYLPFFSQITRYLNIAFRVVFPGLDFHLRRRTG